VRALTIDSLKLERLDLLKLDIEGMEEEALAGAEQTIEVCHPAMLIEHIFCGIDRLKELLEPKRYEAFQFAQNMVFIHKLDKTLDHVRNLHTTLLKQQLDIDMRLEWTNMRKTEAA
jgi:methyltransferase FkbM-like protein